MKQILSSLMALAINKTVKTSGMRRYLLLLITLCPLVASAQDVIVKKDGNTIVCRVVEVGQTEVVYKRWTELQGNNYVMNTSDIASINFENGTKRDFSTEAGNSSLLTTPTNSYIDDASLLNMVTRQTANPSKAKRLKRIGWITGTTLFSAGIICLGWGLAEYNDYSYGYYLYSYRRPALYGPGAAMMGLGIAVTTGCLIRAKRLNNPAVYGIQSEPIWGNDLKLKNGSILTTSINSVRSNITNDRTFGLGLNYQF